MYVPSLCDNFFAHSGCKRAPDILSCHNRRQGVRTNAIIFVLSIIIDELFLFSGVGGYAHVHVRTKSSYFIDCTCVCMMIIIMMVIKKVLQTFPNSVYDDDA